MSAPIRTDHTLTIEGVRELLGQHQPKTITRTGAAPICAKCGGLVIEGFRERTGRDAYLHDFERKVWYCEKCLEVVGR